MKILILTPDTDIDRRIVLQANSLVKHGFEITILGVPYAGDSILSGHIDERIKVKRIDIKDIEYDSKLVFFYKKTHKKIMDFAYKRNDFLNNYASTNIREVNTQSKVIRVFKQLKNRVVQFNTKLLNFISTMIIRCFQKIVNVFYNIVLLFFRKFNINFFPVFDTAFYKAGIVEMADIIVANDLPSLKAGFLLAKEKNIPLVYDAHENYTEQCTLPKRYANQLEKVEAEILPQVDFWIVPNELLGQSIIKKYKDKYNVNVDPPIVIQNAISKWDKYIDFQGCNSIRKKVSIPMNKKILLYQGGFLAKRNLENLVRSMKYVRNKDIVLVMLGFGAFVENLKKIVKRNGLEQTVRFMDAVSQEELLKYTCSADVGIIPYPAIDRNTYYCSPNKLYEFIQARLPILANDLPFLRKVICGEGIGMVQDFSNSRLIAESIDQIFKDLSKLNEYKVKINEIAELINWETEEKILSEKYMKYYNQTKKVSG